MSDHKGSNSSPKRPTSRDIHTHTPHGNESGKNWNYPPGLDNIMATGAFWQNYSGKIVIPNSRKNAKKNSTDYII